MLELIRKIKLYTEAGIILEHMYLFDEVEVASDKLLSREEYKKTKGWTLWGSMQEQNYMDYAIDIVGIENAKHI